MYIILYRILEVLTGQHGPFKIMPYRMGERLKLNLLRHI